MNQEKPFLGTGWSFPPSFNKESRDVAMISSQADINSSLEILLSTGVGERIMQPSYGCDLRKLLFDPIDSSLKAYITDLIKSAVLYHEPRIKLEKVTLDEKPLQGRIDITLEYTIRTTNSRFNYVYPFFLSEGTNVSI
jgi:phage baseplate assembly protein W